MTFRPTRLAIDIPVLCKRKKWDGTSSGPKFDRNGDPIQRQAGKRWTEETKKVLLEEVAKFQKKNPNRPTSWICIQKNPILSKYSTGSLSTSWATLVGKKR